MEVSADDWRATRCYPQPRALPVTRPQGRHSSALFEAEVIPGLESFAIEELRSRLGAKVDRARTLRAGFIRFRYRGQEQDLRLLRSVIAVYRVHQFPIPRPKALLGHQHFARLTKILADASQSFASPPRSLGIGAAGARSSVMRRLHDELLIALKLEAASDGKGQLFIRMLPHREARGWEILLRVSPQALSARAYRVLNMPGSLNATVAYAMTADQALRNTALVVNLCSGTSTILIEHAQTHPQHQLLAIDWMASALEGGIQNARASGLGARIQHIRADARRAPLPCRAADRLYADLPFGHLIGSHESNLEFYPAILREAARLARPDADFLVLTHEVKLLRQCLKQSPWRAASETRINLRGLHPRLFVLKRNSARI